MKITLLTEASKEYWPLMQMTAPNKLEYCLKHDIQLCMLQSNGFSMQGRTQSMIDTLTNTDWLWFMGADTLIMNHKIDVRKFLDENYDVIIGKDINGINNDVMFIKNSAISQYFLYNVRYYNNVEPNDQASMQRVISEHPNLKTKIVHQKEFNSYLYSEYRYPDDGGGSYAPGDFVLHLPGIPNTRRIEIVKEYLNKVDK